MDVDRIEALLKVLNDNEVAEFNYEDESLSVTVSFGRAQVVQMAAAAPVAAPVVAAAAVAPAAGGGEDDLENDPSLETLPSPMVGTFYRAPSPDSEPFVKLGDEVKKGQVLCIIEAMKLMNEIESESDGVVAAILVDNAQPVQFGQPLFKIKTS